MIVASATGQGPRKRRNPRIWIRELLDSGGITQREFEAIKAKAIA